VEYEKGYKIAGSSHWIFPVKLGRTYLALGEADQALKPSPRRDNLSGIAVAAFDCRPAALAKGDAKQPSRRWFSPWPSIPTIPAFIVAWPRPTSACPTPRPTNASAPNATAANLGNSYG